MLCKQINFYWLQIYGKKNCKTSLIKVRCKYLCYGDACGVVVIVIGNGLGNLIIKPG